MEQNNETEQPGNNPEVPQENNNEVNNIDVPDQEDTIPEVLQDSKQIKTVVKNLSTVIKEKLLQLKDLATLEVLLPVQVRMRERVNSIKAMSSAEHLKIQGHWRTTNPSMHITKLEGKKINNDEAEITFSVYEMDNKGNKVLHEKTVEVIKANGDKIQRVVAAEYRIALEITEIIKRNKPITREVLKLDTIKGFQVAI